MLAELAPPPDDVLEQEAIEGDKQALESWRMDIEVVGFNPDEEDD
jgi:hypothetical protein